VPAPFALRLHLFHGDLPGAPRRSFDQPRDARQPRYVRNERDAVRLEHTGDFICSLCTLTLGHETVERPKHENRIEACSCILAEVDRVDFVDAFDVAGHAGVSCAAASRSEPCAASKPKHKRLDCICGTDMDLTSREGVNSVGQVRVPSAWTA
jgi:hypothetical protein